MVWQNQNSECFGCTEVREKQYLDGASGLDWHVSPPASFSNCQSGIFDWPTCTALCPSQLLPFPPLGCCHCHHLQCPSGHILLNPRPHLLSTSFPPLSCYHQWVVLFLLKPVLSRTIAFQTMPGAKQLFSCSTHEPKYLRYACFGSGTPPSNKLFQAEFCTSLLSSLYL